MLHYFATRIFRKFFTVIPTSRKGGEKWGIWRASCEVAAFTPNVTMVGGKKPTHSRNMVANVRDCFANKSLVDLSIGNQAIQPPLGRCRSLVIRMQP